jgi:hypothetical protein
MGEFGWKEVLKQFLDDARAKTLAAAWDGDKYALYEERQSKRLILVTRLHFDSEEHATRFSGQYSEALEKKYSDRSNLFRRPNFFSFDSPDGGVSGTASAECGHSREQHARCLTGWQEQSGRGHHNRRNVSSPGRLRRPPGSDLLKKCRGAGRGFKSPFGEPGYQSARRTARSSKSSVCFNPPKLSGLRDT